MCSLLNIIFLYIIFILLLYYHYLFISADTDAQVNAQAKEITDKNGVQRIEIDKLVTKIRVGNGNIILKSPPTHTLTGRIKLCLEYFNI